MRIIPLQMYIISIFTATLSSPFYAFLILVFFTAEDGLDKML